MPLIPIILLAAGASSRMGGRDKLMIEIDGAPLIRRSARAALATGQPVIVAVPDMDHPRARAIADLPVRMVAVPDAGEGMNASLRRALGTLPPDAQAAMVLLADLPEMRGEDLNTFLQSIEMDGETLIWRGTDATGAAGHPVVFDRSLFGELAALSGDGGARTVVRAHHPQVRLIPMPGRVATLDLDTPEAWQAWLQERRNNR